MNQLTLWDPDPLLDKRQVAERLNVGVRFVERPPVERGANRALGVLLVSGNQIAAAHVGVVRRDDWFDTRNGHAQESARFRKPGDAHSQPRPTQIE